MGKTKTKNKGPKSSIAIPEPVPESVPVPSSTGDIPSDELLVARYALELALKSVKEEIARTACVPVAMKILVGEPYEIEKHFGEIVNRLKSMTYGNDTAFSILFQSMPNPTKK